MMEDVGKHKMIDRSRAESIQGVLKILFFLIS